MYPNIFLWRDLTQLIKNEAMWVVLIFGVTSWCYGMVLSADWWQRLPDMAFAVLAAALVFGFTRLGIPHHSRGPALGVALVLLMPRAALLPFTGHLAAPWFLSAAAALISAKIYLRDGAKPSSFTLLGFCIGVGMAVHPTFIAVLPWALLPAVAAVRERKTFLKTVPWMLILAFAAWAVVRWGPVKELLITLFPYPAYYLAVANPFAIGISDILAMVLWSLALLGFLAGIGRSRPAPPADSRPDLDGMRWNAFWRLAPLFEIQLTTGLLTAVAWICGSRMFHLRQPTLENLLLLSPLAALAAGVGLANIADWLRRQRRIPNWLAEHPTAWGLALLCAANLLHLLQIVS